MASEKEIRLMICDDQAIVCEGLRAIFETVAGDRVVGLASNGVEAVELVERLHPDRVLMNLKMPLLDGVHATRMIREKYSDVRVLVLTTYDTEDWVINAIRSGASG